MIENILNSFNADTGNFTISLKNDAAGRFLHAVRVTKGMLLSEVSSKANLYYHEVSNYEKNKRKLSLETFNALVDALGYEAKIVITKKQS
jgi:transcriptional regulator with XRE-family HTH domain